MKFHMTVHAKTLSAIRGSATIFDGITFDLSSGDCLIVHGFNGSGKSTLLRVLAGLAPLDGGTLTIDPDQIAYAGHLDANKAQMTVAENLSTWSAVYGTNLADQAIAKMDLTALVDRPAATLSAGQKRRLGLARLIVADRSIWIMDEPTTAMDAENTMRVTTLIKDHCAQGGISIAATHIDLDIPSARKLNMGDFTPAPDAASTDPFGEALE
jgi:heme exporter protein A